MSNKMSKFTLVILLCVFANKLVLSQDYDDNHAKVLIVGAGAAGLQAAKEFHDKGMDDLIIVEAANFYGGRVHDVTFAGKQVEAGANWAQPPGTEIIDTVKRLSIVYHESDFESIIIRNETGHDVSEEADPIWEDMEHALGRLAEIGEELIDECRRDMSLRAALRVAGWKPTTPIHKTIEFFDFDFEWADIPAVTSLKSTTPIQLISATGGNLFVTDQGGFKRIFEEITPWLMMDPYKNHLRLNKTVVSIVDKSSNGVEVRCSDGTTYTGDYALVTVSLGVLQNDVIDFQPALPEWKIVKFFQFIMASFAKIFMKFPIQFWENKEWILHASERRGYFPVFLNLNSTGTFPADPNILVSFVTGDEARRIQNQPLAETKAEVEAVMRNMYPNAGVPEATHIYVTDWDTNPLFYGAYSNWPVEVSTEGFEQIQSRVGNVFFAGEHTDPMFNGYIIGATRSGVREASKILSCMKGEECPAYEPPKSYSCPSSGNIATLSFTAALIAALFHSFTAL
ncbi:polyamine oxidase-like [Acanthaster planci]|uniref:Amine oxidase n=1 Tax=Acanthaster planci TaxID=133434 RepID=A0A8B7XHQ7_ACAPL|nr:polyamine oxidase-like [Acanthaster planci]